MLVSLYRLALGLTSFQGAASRPLEAFRRSVNPTQQQPSKPYFYFSVGQGMEAHRPPSETATDRNLCSLPIHLPVLVHPPALFPGISEVCRCARVSPRRALVDFRRAFHPQRFVRPFLVKFLPPQIQGLLFRRLWFQLPPNIPVHAFMAAIVLRVSGTPAFQINPQRHPPNRKPAQTKERLRVRKGRAVVTANGFRQSVARKQPLKAQADGLRPAVGQTPQLQQ